MLKPLITCILVLLLAGQAHADDVVQNLCEGAALLSRAGAMYRADGDSEDAMRAELKRRSNGSASTETIATWYAEHGYRSGKTPEQAYYWGLSHCMKQVEEDHA